MSTPFENITDQIDSFLKSNDVADAAEIDFDKWQTHVFYGIDQGFYGAQKNRGRLPFIEWEVSRSEYSHESQGGGTDAMTVRLRICVGKSTLNLSKYDATKKIQEITVEFLSLLRNTWSTHSTQTNETIEQVTSAPWGFWQEVEYTIDITFQESEYL